MWKSNNLLKSEEGQIMVYTLIVALVAALVVPALIGLTYSGYRSASISYDKMARFYAADTGIEDAIYQIMNRGNGTGVGHNWKVPEAGNTTTTSYYWIGQYTPEVVEKDVINGCNVRLDLVREGNDTYTYTILSTSTDIQKGTEAIIKAKVIVGEGNHTLTGHKPGPGGVSPFSYAVASLGTSTLTLQGSGGTSPTAINGDIYSSGNVIIESNVQILPNDDEPSSVYANGTLVMYPASYVSGDAHSNGNMWLQSGARIGCNAYSGGSILLDPTSRVGNGSYASGDITLNDRSTIGLNAEAGGSISVLHGTNLPDIKTEIFGNASASQNIVVYGAKADKSGIASAIIDGDARYGVSISVRTPTGGIIRGNQIFDTVPAPSLPGLPVLVNPTLAYWQSFYKQEAHGLNPEPDPYEVPLPDVHPVDGYEHGTYYEHSGGELSLGPMHVTYTDDYPTVYAIDLQNNFVLHLIDTVYVDGSVYIYNGCQIVGGGKLIATGDVEIYGSVVGIGNATNLPLIMSINGNILLKNNGNMSAVLYAPNGAVDIGANDVVWGSVVAKSITNKNNVMLTYDERVTSIPGLPGGWEEGNETVPTTWHEPWPGPGAYIIWYNVVK